MVNPVKLKDMEARLCIDFSEETSFEAIELLQQVGFRVSTIPVSGLLGPELALGSTIYYGIDSIKDLVKSLKEKSKNYS